LQAIQREDFAISCGENHGFIGRDLLRSDSYRPVKGWEIQEMDATHGAKHAKNKALVDVQDRVLIGPGPGGPFDDCLKPGKWSSVTLYCGA